MWVAEGMEREERGDARWGYRERWKLLKENKEDEAE